MIIWLFQTGEPLPSDEGNPRPMRAVNLANALVEKGHRVVLWSSGFYHQTKKHRCKTFTKIKISESLEVRLIPSSGYKTNISISRIYDHCVLAWNFLKQLKYSDEVPDVAFIGYPPIEAAYIMVRWLRKQNVPSILDVKDQWPNILVDSVPRPLRFFARVLLSPYYIIAKKAMQEATGICAHSAGFVKWSLNFSSRDPSINDFVAPHTVPDHSVASDVMSNAATWWSKRGVKEKVGFRAMFVGSFSRAFDFDAIYLAAEQLSDQNIDCEFILCGNGEKDDELRSRAKHYDNVKIIEWIDRPKIRALSKISNATIAPNKNTYDFTISIPNKIIDSLMLGLPVFSPLQGEVASLIEKYNVGLSYGNDFPLNECVISLIMDNNSQKQMSANAKNLYESDFEFNKTYNKLVLHLENMANI